MVIKFVDRTEPNWNNITRNWFRYKIIDDNIEEKSDWINDNIQHGWSLNIFNLLYFEDEIDCASYILRWS